MGTRGKTPMMMFHQNWFKQDGYFGDHHCDNSKVIPNHNSLFHIFLGHFLYSYPVVSCFSFLFFFFSFCLFVFCCLYCSHLPFYVGDLMGLSILPSTFTHVWCLCLMALGLCMMEVIFKMWWNHLLKKDWGVKNIILFFEIQKKLCVCVCVCRFVYDECGWNLCVFTLQVGKLLAMWRCY